jgi:hypothetical protein
MFTIVPRGFGFVYHSRTIFCRAVPNPSITIRNFVIAVPPRRWSPWSRAWCASCRCRSARTRARSRCSRASRRAPPRARRARTRRACLRARRKRRLPPAPRLISPSGLPSLCMQSPLCLPRPGSSHRQVCPLCACSLPSLDNSSSPPGATQLRYLCSGARG